MTFYSFVLTDKKKEKECVWSKLDNTALFRRKKYRKHYFFIHI